MFVFISVYFLGWGRTIGGGAAADVLQQALLPVAKHKTCKEKLKNVAEVYKKQILCAGAQGKGGCQVKTIVYLASSKSTIRCLFSVGRSVCPSVFLSVIRSFARSII